MTWASASYLFEVFIFIAKQSSFNTLDVREQEKYNTGFSIKLDPNTHEQSHIVDLYGSTF